MYITAFPHREELFDITNRWLSDRLKPNDPLRITRIINYDSFIAWETMLQFTRKMNNRLFCGQIQQKPLSIKKEVKDFICNSRGPKSRKILELIQEYKRMPEYYYVGSPVAGFVFHDRNDRIISMCRLKRAKRIAEKTSRYAAIHISDKLDEIARELWQAAHQRTDLPEHLPVEFLGRAEKKLMLSIKNEGLILPMSDMAIKDVMGLKIIQNGVSESLLESKLLAHRNVEIIEKEVHSGNYNAIHYIIELDVDRKEMIKRFSSLENRPLLRNRGLSEEDIIGDFKKFIETGSSRIQMDLILITFEELVESEIGRSMHEARIFNQRQQHARAGNILINIEYLIEYLISVGLSPAMHIDEIPIKMWGRYLPDTLSYRIRSLYDMPAYSIVQQ